ncbi:MAG: hypothetical protein ACRCXT_13350 [Paraclostridium sp.]
MGLFKKLLNFGPQISEDKRFLLRRVREDLPVIIPTLVPIKNQEDLKNLEVRQSVMMLLNYYGDNNQMDIVTKFTNVFKYVYHYQEGNHESFLNAVDLFTEDLVRYMTTNKF